MSIFKKLKDGLSKTSRGVAGAFAAATGVNDELFDELEETLILADAGTEVAAEIIGSLRREVKTENLRGLDEVRAALVEIIAQMLTDSDARDAEDGIPRLILVTGVNGAGKTTTIGKLAARLTADGKKVLLVAADTFRAAAGEQLTVWAKRAGCDIVARAEGADPAAVVFDGLAAAKARRAEAVIIDTAGRLQNKENLMRELEKINRVVEREAPGFSRETLLVLDATTGQNGLLQAQEFGKAAAITGIVLTKLDGTAKGGIALAVRSRLGLPVKYAGVGEKTDDLLEFDARDFAEGLVGI
ncbi:MAG: signal recognition particle-docking protein FtsY [Oscillospiraceae bacterium]|jgi:fused signal recognition particle receptor|nr:signal recognition particle-docking protein FtsY [Oscillospiraceae bacterium]